MIYKQGGEKVKTYLARVNGFYEPSQIYYVGEDIEKAKGFYRTSEFDYDFEIEVWENGKAVGRYVPVVAEDDKEESLEYRDYKEETKVSYRKDDTKYYFNSNKE